MRALLRRCDSALLLAQPRERRPVPCPRVRFDGKTWTDATLTNAAGVSQMCDEDSGGHHEDRSRGR